MVAKPDPEYAAPRIEGPQKEAAAEIVESIRAGGFAASLIDGVTGSGKTEVYFEAIAETLRRGKQVLILLPEIALTSAFLERFENRFGAKPGEWHSDLSPRMRAMVDYASGKSAVDYAAADRSLDAALLKARRVFADVDVLVLQTLPQGPYPLADGELANDSDLTSFASLAG